MIKNTIMVKLTLAEIRKAGEFAKLRAKDVDLYKKRGGFKVEDIINGALGEIAVNKLLKDVFPDITDPDFNIYDKSKKSYKADMQSGFKHFHVKSQSIKSAETYGASWLMQRHDPTLQKPEHNHYIVPTVVDVQNKVVWVYGCIPMKTLVSENLVGECVVPIFRQTKVCIYLETLTSNLTPSRRWSGLYNDIVEGL